MDSWETRVLWMIIRQTICFFRGRASIRMSYIEKITKLSEQQINAALTRLIARNVIYVRVMNINGKDPSEKISQYRINLDTDTWIQNYIAVPTNEVICAADRMGIKLMKNNS